MPRSTMAVGHRMPSANGKRSRVNHRVFSGGRIPSDERAALTKPLPSQETTVSTYRKTFHFGLTSSASWGLTERLAGRGSINPMTRSFIGPIWCVAMTRPGNPGNLHDQAWQFADGLVEQMRKARRV